MKNFIAIAVLLMLTGCSTSQLLTSSEPQKTIYSLRPVEAVGEPSGQVARVLEIALPSVPPGMDRDRIALYLADGQKLDYYAGAQWSSTLDVLVQNVTRRTASSVLPYVVAITPDQGITPNYRLQLKINEFQPVYGVDTSTSPIVKANIEFTLIQLPSDKIVTSFTLSKETQVSDNRLDLITLGLENLLQDIEHEGFLKMDEKLRNP